MDNRKDILEISKKYANLIKSRLKIKYVYLFGSYVNGTPKEDSDIDIAIIVDELDDDFLSVSKLLFKLRRKIDIRIEPIIIQENDLSGFLETVTNQGIRLI